jgi:glycosyltransferase involved in cell wall biosynthesis/predicted SAM-dependent methyltransferase
VPTDKQLYERRYWEGGMPDGSGYKFIGYQNFPTQLVVLDKILERKPESLLDIGGAKGYIAKMFEQRTGKKSHCIDISEYCEATRVTKNFTRKDITIDKLPFEDKSFDLVFSIAVLEHIKYEDIGWVIQELARVSKRGLLAPSFYDVGEPDHTHELLVSKETWIEICNKFAPGWPVEIIDKEEFEKGDYGFKTPQKVIANGQEWMISGRYVDEDIATLSGKDNTRPIVLNISSYVVMWRSSKEICVVNTDLPELSQKVGLDQFAAGWGYNFTTYRAPGKLPFKDESVDEIACSHMLEHLTRSEGSDFLKECLRVLKPNGRIRVTVPDAELLAYEFSSPESNGLGRHDIYNVNAAEAEDDAQAFWHMITSGGEHKTAYDANALSNKLKEAGFTISYLCPFDDFRVSPLIGKVGWDMYPESSLYIVASKTNKAPVQNPPPKILEVTPERVSWTAPPPPYKEDKISEFAKAIKANTPKLVESLKETFESIQAGAVKEEKEVTKVCLISPPLIPVNPDRYGGLERVVASLGQGLAQKGLEVTIVAPEGSEVKGCSIFTTGKPTGMQVNWIEAEKEQSLKYKELIEQNKFDIIHDHTWFSRIYGLKTINPAVKICHTHHGHLNPSWVEYARGITPTPNLIAISNWMKKLWLAQYQLFAKTAYNGIDTDLHTYNPNVEVSNRLLFVGRIDKLKRPDIALDIAEKAGLPIDIVGSVDWSANKEYAEQVIDRAKRLGSSVYTEASTAQKIELMQKAKAVIVPSMFGEPFGLVVAESMATGSPVIALDDGGISEIIKEMDLSYGYVCDNPIEMIEKVKELSIDTHINNDYMRSARSRYICSKFSLDSLAKRHIELYTEIVRGNEW